MGRRVAVVLSALVVVSWAAFVAYTVIAAARLESGWSLAPANIVLETIMAFGALAVIWGLVVGVEWIGQLSREIRTPS